MRSALRRATLPILFCLLLAAAPAPPATASRALLSEAALEAGGTLGVPPPEGQIEGLCGVGMSPAGQVYVSDYYHRTIDVFKSPAVEIPGGYVSQLELSGANPGFGFNTLDAVCGLAFDSAGNLYGNEWHEGVLRLTGGEATIDAGESTGVAVDLSTNRLYVDDRSYVAEYALPFTPGDEPLAEIGHGSLGEGFGLAAAGGRVYVADAADQTVEIFAPATSTLTPVATLPELFNSLADAALAVDPTNGHLLVVDNQQPGYEHPKAAVLEFDSAAHGYTFLGTLPGAPVDGGPSGIAVDGAGRAIVTDGNGELSNAFLYGPYEKGTGISAALGPPAAQPPATASVAAPGAGAVAAPAMPRRPHASATVSEVVQRGPVRVSFKGKLAPRTLPRHGHRPVVATVGAKVTALKERTPPQLRKIEIAINRNGHFAPNSLPACRVQQIQPATTAAALAACRRSLVGEGSFSARVLIPEQAPFPSSGKVYAFNGRWHGRPAILAHVYGTEPLPVSYTIPFELLPRNGTYGTLLRASLPAVTGGSGYITGLSLTFGRGRGSHGYLTAGCPLPAGLSIAPFHFAKVSFSFVGGRTLGSVLIRTCKAAGKG